MGMHRLSANLDKVRVELSYQQLRLRHREEQLERFQEQLGYCTIRAPHEGLLVYANEDDDDPQVELGSVVRRHMDLFYLPDLSEMVLNTTIHESVVKQVETGQTAQILITALPKVAVEGHVEKVDPLPITPTSWRANQEIKNFLARIKLNSVPEGLLPGMTATVEILTAFKSNALVVPTNALTMEGEQDICYVADGEDVQRRVVKVSPGNRQVVEITEGLEEGEEVILDPDQFDLGGHRAARPIGQSDPNWWEHNTVTSVTN
jgi:HlyD family secretion protein